jgi:Zn finger protein HypA/HybF involved in hydrogenase expression
MHELAICSAILSQALAIADTHGVRVKRINLNIGPLAGVEPHLRA